MWTNTRYFAKGATAIDYIFFPGTNIRENTGNTGPCVPESSTRSPDEEKVFATSNGHDTMKRKKRKRERERKKREQRRSLYSWIERDGFRVRWNVTP